MHSSAPGAHPVIAKAFLPILHAAVKFPPRTFTSIGRFLMQMLQNDNPSSLEEIQAAHCELMHRIAESLVVSASDKALKSYTNITCRTLCILKLDGCQLEDVKKLRLLVDRSLKVVKEKPLQVELRKLAETLLDMDASPNAGLSDEQIEILEHQIDESKVFVQCVVLDCRHVLTCVHDYRIRWIL